MPPLSTKLADKGYVTDALAAHYAARALGGVTWHFIGDGQKAGNLKGAITQGYQIAKDL